MMTQVGNPPTQYPYVNEVLHTLLSRVKHILGQQFCGLYLYGSLASGDFNPQRSDIDFLVVTNGLLSDETIAQLREMHAQLWGSGDKWAGKLEGAYLPRQLLHKYQPDGPDIPTVNEGKFYLAALGSDWVIQYHILREHSSAVEGPGLRELIAPVDPESLRQSVRQVLDEWWRPMLSDHHWLERSEYQAYAVLTMCRALNTLQEGAILSKGAAAHWARRELDEKWCALIDWAEQWPQEQGDKLEEVLELVRYMVTRAS